MSGKKLAQRVEALCGDGALRHLDNDGSGRARPGSLQMVNLLRNYRRVTFIGELKPSANEHHLIGLQQVFIPVELLRPADDLHGAMLILQPEQSESVSLFRDLRRQVNDDSSQGDLISVRGLVNVTSVKPRQSPD